MITLYHGTNIEFDKIDLSICSPNKDFGQGFYLTDIKEQAEQMAIRRTRIADFGEPTILKYRFDETLLNNSELKVKIFTQPSEEWALFIMENRKASRTNFKHNYDIVVGPIADDGVVFQLERYVRNMITLETLVQELTFKKLNIQYFFGTDLAISKLTKV